MDSCQHKDSKSSSDDADGAGRSHGCVFCKRGFTTAQALGGHMNIHRRDRAKIKQNEAPSISNVPDFSPISSHPPPSPPPEAKRSYYANFPSSTSNPSFPLAYHSNEDLRTDLSLQIGPRKVEQSEKEKRKKREEDEVDLELRLGLDP